MIVKISESIINEALKPSEFRDLMKVGRELAVERINQIWPRLEAMADAKNRSGDRLYFNIEQSNDLDLLQKNSNEKSVAASLETEYLMVISKHPYDIGGMSTNRSWTSCMNLRGGENSNYVPIDISQGTIISYLIQRNDKNIQDPVSRILIKPYMEQDGRNDILYGIERDLVKYGRNNEKYIKKLISVLDKAQEEKTGIFEIDNNLYLDSDKRWITKINDKQIEELQNKIKNQVKELRDGLTFEIITKKFPWLYEKNVVFKDAILGFEGEYLKWYDGIWINGVWKGGYWENGVWRNGIWEKGVWDNGVWEKGIWKKGNWLDGRWEDGDWEKGNWKKGIWKQGTWIYGYWEGGSWEGGSWRDGTWKNGTWKNGWWFTGTWKNGTWRDGIWKNGVWENGNWKKGVWINGIWQGGDWKNGTWKKGVWGGGKWVQGIWEEGKIWNQEEREYIESNTPPK